MATLTQIRRGDGPGRPLQPSGPGRSGTVAPDFHPGEISTIEPRRLLGVFLRRFRLIACVALPILATVALFTLMAKPKYEAAAEIMLEPRSEKITKIDEVLPGLPVDSTIVDSEIEVLRSPELAVRVVKSLKLDEDPEFSGVSAPAAGPPSEKAFGHAVSVVIGGLAVGRAGLTYAIQIRFRSRSPAKAAMIANKFASLYLAQQVQDKLNATKQAAQWLGDRLQQLSAQVLADDAAVQKFKIDNNLLSAQGATLTEQEISSYDQSLAQASAEWAADQARLQTAMAQLASGSSGDDVGEALDSPTIQQLKQQRVTVSRELAVLRAQFKEGYPELQRARGELANIDAEIRAETRRIISNLQAKVQVAGRRAAAIRATLAGAKGQLAANNRASVRLSELQRNLDASRALHESFLARYKEARSQEGLAQPDARLISTAGAPTQPSSPNVPLNLMIGMVLAIGAGLGAAGLAEMLDSGIATSADIEKRLSLKYLGAVPLLRSTGVAPFDHVVAEPWSSFSEAFRSVRAAIASGPGATVVVTSSVPQEGKTTTAACLARFAALQGSRVVIVDCDLRRPGLNRLFKWKPRVGLLEVLAGTTGLAEALVEDGPTGMHVLPLSDGPLPTEDVFGSPAMDQLLVELGKLYDLVILDTPPVLPVADARILARKVDLTVIVARWRSTPHPAIEGALYLLSADGVEVGGVVLNMVDLAQHARHGYGDIIYYHSLYNNYYGDIGPGRTSRGDRSLPRPPSVDRTARDAPGAGSASSDRRAIDAEAGHGAQG